MNRRSLCLLLFCCIFLSACGKRQKNETVTKKEKIDVTMFEENDKRRSKHEGYIMEDVYLNGKLVTIDAQNHGDHYHIIFEGKKYTLSKAKFLELKNPDNKIVFANENLEKNISDIDPNAIISYYKHGDHWHVITKNGEFITYQDPIGLKTATVLKKNAVQTVSNTQLNGLKIVRYYRHGDHWHVFTSDGKEYITYSNPVGISTISQITEKKESIVESNKGPFEKIVDHGDHIHVWVNGKEYVIDRKSYDKAISENKFVLEETKKIDIVSTDEIKTKKVVITWKHDDHWHVLYDDGTEVIVYSDPSESTNSDDISHLDNEFKPKELFDKPFEKAIDYGNYVKVWIKNSKNNRLEVFQLDKNSYNEIVKRGYFFDDKESDLTVYGLKPLYEVGKKYSFDVSYTFIDENNEKQEVEDANFKWYVDEGEGYKLVKEGNNSEDEEILEFEYTISKNNVTKIKVTVEKNGKTLEKEVTLFVAREEHFVDEETKNIIKNIHDIYEENGELKIKWWHINHYHYEKPSYRNIIIEKAPDKFDTNGKKSFKVGDKTYYLAEDRIFYIENMENKDNTNDDKDKNEDKENKVDNLEKEKIEIDKGKIDTIVDDKNKDDESVNKEKQDEIKEAVEDKISEDKKETEIEITQKTNEEKEDI